MSARGALSVVRFYQASALEAVMRRRSERSLWYLISLALLALLIVGVATTRSMSRYADSVHRVSHTRKVETAVESIRADLYAAQNGCFDYVFAGRPEGLQQLQSAADALPDQISQLRSLASDNPSQQSLLSALEPLIHQQIAFLRTSAAMKDKGDSPELLQEFAAQSQTLSQPAFAKLESMRPDNPRPPAT